MSKVLIIGSGGREHALGWKLTQSDRVAEVLYAPGNGGTATGKGRNVPWDISDASQWDDWIEWLQNKEVDLVLVGPEAPLAAGFVDHCQLRKFPRVFGPTQAAARLESDKFFSYHLMDNLGIPQAASTCCTQRHEAEAAIRQHMSDRGVVLKARGLAGGKGVLLCNSQAQAFAAYNTLADIYGPDVLVSERLEGPEFSVFGIADGQTVHALPVAFQDHKRLHDNDQGPNTGGMGAYGPTSLALPATIQRLNEEVMIPVVQAMRDRGHPYVGFLYAGFMQTEDGPKVLEFNVRFGDPECQPAMALLESDLYQLLDRALAGNLNDTPITFAPGAACCVVLASRGYPGATSSGHPIHGLKDASALEHVHIFHAGTATKDGEIRTAGGRVLGVTGVANEGLAQARQRAYDAVRLLSIEGGFHYRHDIASRALFHNP